MNTNYRGIYLQSRQKGIATMMTVILMLLMMTTMVLYGTRVGVFEQIASANDARQKQAFHAAEAGINIVSERIRANSDIILSSETNGWFAAASLHWLPCPADPAKIHPCYAEKGKANTFYFVEDAALPDITTASLGVNVLPADQGVEVGAVLCPLDVDYSVDPPIVNPDCTLTPGNEMLITLISRATSDNGRGQAVIKQVFADYDIAAGVPGVALSAPLVGLPNGSADIVANPNGGGEGVPLSIWSKEPLVPNGDLRTCEAQEFYGQSSLPDDISCPGCDCTAGSELSDKFTQYSDIRDGDPFFPDDMFEDFFGVPKAKYESIKNSMTNVNGCDSFDSTTNGAYWVNGDCAINGNPCKIGTQDNPVLLVISGDFTSTGCDVFGLVFITEVENPGVQSSVAMNGQATVYGAVMVDHDMSQSNGSLAIVYNEDVLKKASTFNGIAPMPGGWSDFL